MRPEQPLVLAPALDLGRHVPPIPEMSPEHRSLFAWLKAGVAAVVLSTLLTVGCASPSALPPPAPPTPGAPGPTPFVTPFPCSPNNYTQASDNDSWPYTYCPWNYLPWRVWLPASPAHIDTTNTTRLRQYYLPNGAHGGFNNPDAFTLATIGYKPVVHNQGFPGAAVYVAKPTDPLVTVHCAGTAYGCSDASGHDITKTVGTFQIRMPKYTRGSCNLCPVGTADDGLGVLQPDGREFGMYQCHITRDVVDGDTIGTGGSLCVFAGAYYGNVTTEAGVNNGNTSGGNTQSALDVYWQEVNHGQINHALGVPVGCISGNQHPAAAPSGPCPGFTGIPTGALIWLRLTRAQIDADTNIPANMKVFAYALHEHGAYVLDTGGSSNSTGATISQFYLEEVLAPLYAGALSRSPWYDWFKNNGGSVAPGGDAMFKLQNNNIFPWNASSIINNMYVLDKCYTQGTCSDSIPDPGYAAAGSPTIAISAPVKASPKNRRNFLR
jgi:hypothetical protein